MIVYSTHEPRGKFSNGDEWRTPKGEHPTVVRVFKDGVWETTDDGQLQVSTGTNPSTQRDGDGQEESDDTGEIGEQEPEEVASDLSDDEGDEGEGIDDDTPPVV